MKRSVSFVTALGIALMAGSAMATTALAQSDKVDFAKYMQSAASAGAVATAIASLEGCPNPFTFSEDKEDDNLVLNVHCDWNEGESSVSVIFSVFGDKLLPLSFRHAG